MGGTPHQRQIVQAAGPRAASYTNSGTNEYGDFCLHVDDTVGRVMSALEKHGLTENTIVIFTSDNGCSPMADFAELAESGHNPSYLFRGHKADIYEGGHRIPLIIRWPETIQAGTQSDQTVWTYTTSSFRRGNHAYYRGAQLPAPFSYPWLEVFQIELPDGTPSGTYTLAIAIPEAGAAVTLDDISYSTFEVVDE